MKTWADLTLIAMPPDIAALPKDARGYPIPRSAVILPDGTPDFRTINQQVWAELLGKRRCAICGGKMGLFTFVGGPKSVSTHSFIDGPMHQACAEYALAVCPFLAAPKFAYRKSAPEIAGLDVHVNEQMSTERPAYFGLAVTSGYKVHLYGGEYVIRPDMYVYTEWWKDGVKLEKEPS
jgi:hypothetical protein